MLQVTKRNKLQQSTLATIAEMKCRNNRNTLHAFYSRYRHTNTNTWKNRSRKPVCRPDVRNKHSGISNIRLIGGILSTVGYHVYSVHFDDTHPHTTSAIGFKHHGAKFATERFRLFVAKSTFLQLVAKRISTESRAPEELVEDSTGSNRRR